MNRVIALLVMSLALLLLIGCAAPVQVDCRLPMPPESLMVIPAPLPPVPADMPTKDK